VEITILVVEFSLDKAVNATSSQLRGFFATKFNEYLLLHQHKQDGFLYKYPLIQYKIINNIPTVIGINEGSGVLVEIFNEYDTLNLGKKSYRIVEKHVKYNTFEVGISDSLYTYTFLTPWIALNQENYSKYLSFTHKFEMDAFLGKVLIGNILSFSKTLGYTVPSTLVCEVLVKPKKVQVKGVPLMAFFGSFQVNYKLPDVIGLGKSVSRGYGVITSANPCWSL
jgi:hypothetical protein